MDKTTILTKIRLLGEAGLQPYVYHLAYRGGWCLTITNHTWIDRNTPRAELPNSNELKSIDPTASVESPVSIDLANLPDGITVQGGYRVPSLTINLPGSEAMVDQYEALSNDVAADLQIYSKDYSYKSADADGWFRFCFEDWLPPDPNRQTFDNTIPLSADNPFVIQGREMRVLRACGCVTSHWQTPGKGRNDSPSKRKFGKWLASQPCLKHSK